MRTIQGIGPRPSLIQGAKSMSEPFLVITWRCRASIDDVLEGETGWVQHWVRFVAQSAWHKIKLEPGFALTSTVKKINNSLPTGEPSILCGNELKKLMNWNAAIIATHVLPVTKHLRHLLADGGAFMVRSWRWWEGDPLSLWCRRRKLPCLRRTGRVSNFFFHQSRGPAYQNRAGRHHGREVLRIRTGLVDIGTFVGSAGRFIWDHVLDLVPSGIAEMCKHPRKSQRVLVTNTCLYQVGRHIANFNSTAASFGCFLLCQVE